MTAPARPERRISVAQFLEAGRQRLSLVLEAGQSGLGRRIGEAALNRPGLALTGFFRYFAHRRIQILGYAEHTYLTSLGEAERESRLRRLFERRVPCLVFTRHLKVMPEIRALGDRFRTPILRTPLITKHFINAATILMEELRAPRTLAQGTMVEILGVGVLLEGAPGVGKSETALALVKMGHSLVADDVTSLRLDSSGAVLGSAVGVTRYHMEIRGLGIVHVPSLFGVASVRGEKQLDLIIQLRRADPERAPGEGADAEAMRPREVLGVSVPVIVIPVAPGRDLANLVETAALNEKLKRLGHDAAKELDDKLKAVLTGQKRPA
jgi:HPr kinase/phosphorylase